MSNLQKYNGVIPAFYACYDKEGNVDPTVVREFTQYLLDKGGLEAMHQRNLEKASVLYNFLDNSKFFTGAVRKEDRSLMNVPFVTPSQEQDAQVVAATKAAGFDNLKGHKSVGGLRASSYNAMPKEGVEALVDFLKKYEAEHA